MELLLRRYLWSLDLCIVALCAIFLGSAAALAVGDRVPSISLTITAAKRAPPAQVRDKSPDVLLARNIFCSDCAPGAEPVAEASEAPPSAPLPLIVVAIMNAQSPRDRRWSRVVLRDTEDRATGAYGIGDHVRGGEIIEIESTRVSVHRAGRTEFLDLLAQPKPPAPVPAAAISKSPGQSLDIGVKKLAENKYEIQRATLESMLGDTARLTSAGRPIVEIRDGRLAGFRLMAVRSDGPLGQLGLRNGDVVSAVNGLALTSPEQALAIYLKLRSVSHVSINLERDGRQLTQEYQIR